MPSQYKTFLHPYLEGKKIASDRRTAEAERKALKQESDLKALKEGYRYNPATRQFEDIPGSAGSLKRQGEVRGLELENKRSEYALELIEANEQRQTQFYATETVRQFIDTRDPDVLNKAMVNVPALGEMLKARGIDRFYKIDLQNDRPMLRAIGIDIERLDSDPEYARQVSRSYYKYSGRGQDHIGSVKNLMQETNADLTLNQDRINAANEGFDLVSKLSLTPQQTQEAKQASRDDDLAELKHSDDVADKAIDNERLDKRLDFEVGDAGVKNAIAEEKNDIAQQKADTASGQLELARQKEEREAADKVIDQELAREKYNNPSVTPTERERNIDASNRITQEIYKEFGVQNSTQLFDNWDNYTPEQKAYLSEKATNLDYLQTTEPATVTKKAIEDIGIVTGLLGGASGLKNADVGIIDNITKDVLTYITNAVGNEEGRIAYRALRNFLRHKLFGATLTAAEIKSFRQAFGTENLQLSSVLQRVLQQARTTKDRIGAIISSDNAFTLRIRLGASNQALNSTTQGLATIISRIDPGISVEQFGTDFEEGNLKPAPSILAPDRPKSTKSSNSNAAAVSADPRNSTGRINQYPPASLDDIFGGNGLPSKSRQGGN